MEEKENIQQVAQTNEFIINNKNEENSFIDTIIPNTFTEIQDNILISDTSQELITKINNKELKFSDLLEVISNHSTKPMRDKIISVFLCLDARKQLSDEYLEKIESNNRNVRQISVLCALEKLKYLTGTKSKDFKILFDKIFPNRLRDVDNLIRVSCLETFCHLCISNSQLLKKHFKFISFALNDKTETVRKAALRAVLELFSNTQGIKKQFISIKNRLMEILEFDKCKMARNLSSKVLFKYFKAEYINNEEVLKALNTFLFTKTLRNFLIAFYNENSEDGYLNEKDLSAENPKEEDFRKYERFLFHKDGFYMPLTLHFMSSKITNQKIIFSNLEFKYFIDFVCWKESQGFVCCEKENCYLEVLKIIKIDENCLNELCKLKDKIKHKKENLKIFSEILESIDKQVLMSCAEKVEDLIKELGDKKVECLPLFQSLKPHFKISVNNALENYAVKHKMKYFDFSEELKEKDDVLTKCYAIFWFLIKNEFKKIEELNLTNNLLISDIAEFLEIVEFYQKKSSELKITDEPEVIDDLSTAIHFIFKKLKEICKENIKNIFSRSSTAVSFIDFIERKIFEKEIIKEIFLQADKNIYALLNLKSKQEIFEILFGLIKNLEDKEIKKVNENLKILIPKIKKGTIKIFLLFNEICLNKKYEDFLIEIIPLLKYEDAIVLENKTTGNLKNCLNEKIKKEEK